jgi:threonine dehydrogenase-like Zn-dependent dehydrogenase
MWAHQLVGPGVFEKVHVPAPDPAALQPGETLLRVEAGAVCGSDLPFFAGRRSWVFRDDGTAAANIPGFPLHEVVGEVLATDDPELPVGGRAVGWATRTTALAEFTVTRGDNLLATTPGRGISDALTLQPLACVTETLRRLGDLAGLRVAVLGLGPFGLLFAHVARTAGAAAVIGVDRIDRSDVAEAFRIDELVHASSDRWAAAISPQERPDVVIEAVGHQTGTLHDAVDALAEGGRLFYFGVPDEAHYVLPMQKMFRKRLTLATGAAGDRRNALRRADRYLRTYPDLNDAYVTHTFPMDQAQAAFELASTPARGRLKVQLLAPA